MKVKGDFKISCWAVSKMLSTNQIAEFLKQIYLKKDWVNQRDILYVVRDSRKVNCK